MCVFSLLFLKAYTSELESLVTQLQEDHAKLVREQVPNLDFEL